MWAVRCPGGPTKIVKSEKPISESTVKQSYLESFSKIRTDAEKDKEMKLVLDTAQFEKYVVKRDELFWKGVSEFFF